MNKTALFRYLERHRSGDVFRKHFESREALQHYAGQQAGRWVSLIEAAKTSLQRMLPPSAAVMDTLLIYQQSISQKFIGCYAGQDSEGITLDSRLPLLDEIAEDAPEGDTWAYVGAIVFWLSEFALVSGQIDVATFSDPRIQRGMAEVAASSRERIGLPNGSVRSADKLPGAAKSILEDKFKQVDAAVSHARETRVFADARTLWQQKAREHTKSYSIGFLALAACVVVLAVAIRYQGVEFWEALPRNPRTGEYTYLASFLVGITFLGFACVVRIIGRFVKENFTLAADAQLRQTILETFLNLVGTAGANMSEGERVLILSALFRPAPGQGVEAPPSWLMELARDAAKASGR